MNSMQNILRSGTSCSAVLSRMALVLGALTAICHGPSVWAAVGTGENAPIVQSNELHLIPQPRETGTPIILSLASGVVVRSTNDAEDRFAAQDLREALQERGIRVEKAASARPGHVTIELLRLSEPRATGLLERAHVKFDDVMRSEGYVILPNHSAIAIVGNTAEGVFYGAQTVKQLVQGSGSNARLQAPLIRDWPAMRFRGLSDDLSRGPIPTLEFQKKQIRTIAAYKQNIYSSYFEHTLAYASNPLIALPDGAMTPEEVEELVRYARGYHVTIVPEQEAFGHLHHVLTWEQYSQLAETPHGHVLSPGQTGTMPLIEQWFGEMTQMFPGPFIHVGADETFELGRGQTSAAVKERGLGSVYVHFLSQMYQGLQPLHKRILFWGDIARKEPQLVKMLPKEMIAVAWTYNPNPEGFDAFILPFTQAGMETWVAPGVNNWLRVYPDNTHALPNIQGLVRDGQRLGSTGMLNTVWNDDGEGLFDEDWYGVLFGAAASWQPGQSSIEAYQRSYGSVFHGDTTGKVDQAQKELMEAHRLLGQVDDRGASDDLFWVDPWSVVGQADAKKMRPIAHDVRLHAEHALVLLAEARRASVLREQTALAAMELGARRIDLIGLKFQLADEIVAAYAQINAVQHDPSQTQDIDRLLDDISEMNGRCQDLRDGYSLIRDQYEKAWLRENHPYWMHNVLEHYDVAIQLWIRRGEAVDGARKQWQRTKVLPKPEELGIPANAVE